MTLTIIPLAPAVTAERPYIPSVSTGLLNLSPASSESRFLRTSLPPPFSGSRAYHPLWMTHDSQYPQAIVDGEMPEEVPSAYRGMSAEWAATVSQLVCAGLAEISGGVVTLTDFLRIRAPKVKSVTISSLAELEWILNEHRDNTNLSSGVIEPVPYSELIGPARTLSEAIKSGTASETDRAMHTRLFRALIRRVEDDIETLRGKRNLDS